MLIVSMQMMVDGVFVNMGVGAQGLAAVNLSMPLMNVMLSIGLMIVSGGVVIAGVAKGSRDEGRCRGYTLLTFLLLVGTLTLLPALLMTNFTGVCRFLGADEALMPYVRGYLGILLPGSLFFCIPNFTEAFTRLRGRPNMVFVSGAICFAVNALLDYVFVLRWNWGMRGAAVATCSANTLAAVVLFPMVKMGRIRGTRQQVGRNICKIFFNGSSEMLTSVASAVTTFAFNLVLMHRTGYLGVAALTIVFYVNLIVNMSLFGLSQALYPLMAYNLGARNLAGIKTLLRTALLSGAVIGIGVYVSVTCCRESIVQLFARDNDALAALTRTAMTFITLHYLISFVNVVGCSFHTAIERPVESAAIALSRSIVFVLAALWTLPHLWGDTGIWITMPVAEALCLAVTLPLMRYSLRRLERGITGGNALCKN